MTDLGEGAGSGHAARRTWSTGFPAVDAVLRLLTAEVRAALGKQLIGVYLHGSLAAGGFEPGRSDVDVLVATEGELGESRLAALEVAHTRLQASGMHWATRLEVSYIPRGALRRYDPGDASHPALRMDGSFDVDEHGPDWVLQRHVIRERSIVLSGPAPHTLIAPISAGQIRWAARETLYDWWAPQLVDQSRLRSDEYQAYAVLTMCRAFYTLQHADVAPKAVAASWAQGQLGRPWADTIERALAWRHGDVLDALEEVLALIRYTLDRADAHAARS